MDFKALRNGLFTGVTAVLLPAAAQAETTKEVVYDSVGQNVHDVRGNCILTNRDATSSICGQDASQALTIYFGFNSSKLTNRAAQQLDSVFAEVTRNSNVRSLNVVGYADEIGAASYNSKLSSRRALAVKSYLEGKGYTNAEVAKVRGLGESNSQTDCEGISSREERIACLGRDRRVELEVQYRK